MANPSADRNLLFGILAVQMDFISRDALIAAMNAWVLNKDKSLGHILLDQKAVSKERHALLEALVGEHLKAHGDDAEKSLAAAGLAGPVREALHQVADADVHASLASLPPSAGPRDQYATRMHSTDAAAPSGQRFRILRPHARGGLGEVLVAQDEELHREVALKHIQDPIADQPESRARFLLEAEITGGLEHPGVVPVYGLGQYSDGRPYYAMRFIRGDSLKDVVARFHQPNSPGRGADARNVEFHDLLNRFIAVCHAVGYAHGRGVLHRDLKPANVMLGEYGETLVVDWGLAKLMGRAEPESRMPPLAAHASGSADAAPTLAGQMVGTAAYMAPEQAQGRLDQIDERTDIYGLGAILFEILTGKPPHPGKDVYEILKAVLSDPTPRARTVAPSVHPALDAICAKAMARDRDARYRRALDLAADVRRFLADEPVGAWREPWPVRARRWVGRHRTLVTSSAAVVVVAAVSLAAASVLLQQAYSREAAAHRDAEENYQRARDAVRRYYTEVSENDLFGEPGMDPVRKKLLQQARDYDEAFVRERGNDPAARADLAESLFRLGRETWEIEPGPKAIGLQRQALDLYTDLTAKNPTDPDLQKGLAACHDELGRLYRLSDRMADAEEAYKKALDVWEPLARDHLEDDYRAGLARSRLGLGNVYQATRRLGDAADHYGKALAVREELAHAHPDNLRRQRDLAVAESDLAMVYHEQGDALRAKEAYHRALDVLEGLGRGPSALSQYKNDLARSLFDLAHLCTETGDFDKAVDGFKDAADLWAKLAERNPDVPDFAMSRAEAYGGLVETYVAANNLAAAEDAALQCIAIRRSLAEAHPDLPRCQGDFGRAHYFLGRVYRAAGQPEKAEAAFRDALRIQEPLAAKVSGDPTFPSDLGWTYNELGGLYLDGGKAKASAAGEQLHKALDVWQKLTLAHPDLPDCIQGLASCENYLGEQARAEDRIQDAVDWYARAIQVLESAGDSLRRQAVAQSVSRNAHWRRAEALEQLTRFEAALADWDKAVDLTADPERDWFRVHRARAKALAGDHAAAAAEAAELTGKAENNGEALYSLAGVYSRCATAAATDAKLSAEQRKKVGNGYADQALDLLRKARAAGYFQDAANRERLKTDPDLEGVRSRPAFMVWLNEI